MVDKQKKYKSNSGYLEKFIRLNFYLFNRQSEWFKVVKWNKLLINVWERETDQSSH